MSGISGISSGYMSYMYAQNTTGTQNRAGRGDLFSKIDKDSSSGVSKTELDSFIQTITKNTGTTIDTDEAITTYDTDGDGELSSTELKSFLDASGLSRPPAPPMGGMMGMQGGPSPEDLFDKTDSDDSGGISQEELDAFASDFSEKTGATLDTGNAVSTYDADGDGELDADEMQSFLDESGLQASPPPPMGGMQGGTDDLFQSLADDALSAYDSDGSGELSGSELLSLLKSGGSNASSDFIMKALSAYAMNMNGYGSSSSVSYEV